MNAWRPENWDTKAIMRKVIRESDNPDNRAMIEAGADAVIRQIFEELEGMHLFISSTLEEGTPVVYVGCYVLRWGKEEKPTIGFIPLSDDEDWQALKSKWLGEE